MKEPQGTLFPGVRTDARSENFLKEIAEQMAKWFPISLDDATAKVAARWSGSDLVDYTMFFKDPNGPHARGASMPIVLYNDCPCFWAQAVWYGTRDFWRTHDLRSCHNPDVVSRLAEIVE